MGESRVDPAAVALAADAVITALAGPGARVRDDQLEAVNALVVDRRRCLVVQATGWGKSAVYWIAARAVRDAGSGPVLVVSPLLALMRDQVAAAARAGLRAVTLNSANFEDWAAVEADVLAGDVDVLLVSPERLANPRFAESVLEPLLPASGSAGHRRGPLHLLLGSRLPARLPAHRPSAARQPRPARSWRRPRPPTSG